MAWNNRCHRQQKQNNQVGEKESKQEQFLGGRKKKRHCPRPRKGEQARVDEWGGGGGNQRGGLAIWKFREKKIG